MNQHSIPIDVHRKLGLDNIEPSGLEGDRRLADVEAEAAKAKEAAKKPHEPLEPLEGPICELVRTALITATMAEAIERKAMILDKAAVGGDRVLKALDEELSTLYVLVDDLRSGTTALRDKFYASWNEVVS